MARRPTILPRMRSPRHLNRPQRMILPSPLCLTASFSRRYLVTPLPAIPVWLSSRWRYTMRSASKLEGTPTSPRRLTLPLPDRFWSSPLLSQSLLPPSRRRSLRWLIAPILLLTLPSLAGTLLAHATQRARHPSNDQPHLGPVQSCR